MRKPLAVVIGFIGKLPLAGMALYNLHHVAGLHELGYEVHYLERQNKPNELYDPASNTMTDDPAAAMRFLQSCLPRFGIGPDRYSFIDRHNRCHGSGWQGLQAALDRTDFVLVLCDLTWFDDLERCPRRAFVDGDPLFTQVALAESEDVIREIVTHYPVLFTYGTCIGLPSCTIPSGGRHWFPARPVVATSLWKPIPMKAQCPISTVMNWSSGRELVYEGRVYGYKGRELERLIDLPRHSSHLFHLALGGDAPRRRLLQHGWRLIDPLQVTGTLEEYRAFIDNSWADLGIAKHAYVASRSGWFSDRSTCYLAAGRPVLHQDTGCGDWLPAGEGVLLFSDIDDVLEALEALEADYERHARAARRIAEEHFEAATVLGHMLDQAGFR